MLGTIPEQPPLSPRGKGTRLLDLAQAYPKLQGNFAVLLELARPGAVVRRLARAKCDFWSTSGQARCWWAAGSVAAD
jgi:hypothetical protein